MGVKSLKLLNDGAHIVGRPKGRTMANWRHILRVRWLAVLALATVGMSAYGQEVTTNPLHHWTFDTQNDAGEFIDEVSHTVATPLDANEVKFVEGKFGKAVQFTNSFLRLP